jgi:predicted RNA polymerase sigma factor
MRIKGVHWRDLNQEQKLRMIYCCCNPAMIERLQIPYPGQKHPAI